MRMEQSKISLARLGSPTTCCGRKSCVLSAASQGVKYLSPSSLMKEVRRALLREGFTATKTRGGHWRFEHPQMCGPVFAPDTPSDYRGVKNLKALLRRKLRAANDN